MSLTPAAAPDDATQGLPLADLEHIVSSGHEFWQALAGERLFITGGTGFFGIWLLAGIAAANRRLGTGIRACVLSRDPAAFATRFPMLATQAEFSWWRGDIRDFEFPAGEFGQVIHAATPASAALNRTRPQEMLDIVVDGTRRVLAFARHCRARRLLLTSSGAIYGSQPLTLAGLGEDHAGGPDPTAAGSAYAEGKRVAELLGVLATAGGGPEIKIARCFAFIGPQLPLDAHFAAGNFVRDLLHGQDITIRGDGRSVRSYLHAADLVVWLLAVLVRGRPGRPYNVGSDVAVSIAELAELLAANRPGTAVHILGEGGPEAATRYVPAIGRAREELGVELHIPLESGIRRWLDWEFRQRDRIASAAGVA